MSGLDPIVAATMVQRVGDRVAIVEARPMSRRKRWVVTRVVEKAKQI